MNSDLILKDKDLENIATCDLCGGEEFTQELKINEWVIMKCNNCQLFFTSPRYSQRYIQDLYQNAYYDHANQYLMMQLGKIPSDLLQFLVQVMKICSIARTENSLRSLDVGCGGGLIVTTFKEAGWESVGIDLNKKAIHAGRELGLDLRTMDIEDPGVEIGKFDIITAFHILEHVISPKVFLQHCWDLLNIGGLLAVEVPDFGCRDSSNMREFWPHLYPHLHLYQFTKETLIRYLLQERFQVIRIEKVHGRGPLENWNASQKKYTVQKRIKDFIFELRKMVYWIPKVRDIARYLIWETFGYGQFLRVIARKSRWLDGGQ